MHLEGIRLLDLSPYGREIGGRGRFMRRLDVGPSPNVELGKNVLPNAYEKNAQAKRWMEKMSRMLERRDEPGPEIRDVGQPFPFTDPLRAGDIRAIAKAAASRMEKPRVLKAGIYRGVSSEHYFSDPCPMPSLTQSLCKLLIERSPRHAWVASPSLNGDWLPDDDTKFDLGNVAHKVILERGKEFEVFDFDSWRTKVSQEAREEAHKNGKVAILLEQFEQAVRMAQAARKQLVRHEDNDAFLAGSAEVMICWQEDGIWFRSLIDWLHDDLRTVDDFKSSGMSMAAHVIGLRAETAGWHIQAAFIERGLDVLDPAGAGRRKFRFIAQETDEPHALNVMRMDEHWMTLGRKKVQAGVDIWRRCIETDRWPAYPPRSITPDYPGFKEKQWLERELSGEFEELPSLMGG